MNKKQTVANCLLVLVALIWGCGFVAQSVGMDYIRPFTFNGVRNLISGVVLLPVMFFMDKHRKKNGVASPTTSKKKLWLGGLLCGLALCVASALQQIGISMPGTTSGKAGFITALYIVLVPVLSLFLKKSAPAFVWLGVALATVGLYLLCITEDFSITQGDFYLLLCALMFSVHILIIDHFSPLVDGVRMSCIQFFVTGIICLVCAFIFETPRLQDILAASIPLLYAGVLSSGVGYTVQIIAQKNTSPTVASLLLSLESVFAVLCGWLLLNEILSAKEMFGCVLVFVAIILAQLPSDIFKKALGKKSTTKN